jgi:aminotransferase EvaB
MTIKAWDYLKEYEQEKEDIHDAIEKVFQSGKLILGDNVRRFEQEFARYCNVKFGVGVNSGTDALFLCLKALGIGEDDEVITVSNTAVPTVSAIVSAGATPRFVDIDPETYLMDSSQLENAITKKTRCILPVHLYGQCVNMDDVQRVADANGLHVIEDCAQSHGAAFRGKKAGSMSQLAAFSFYPTKVLGGYGDGGMVTTSNRNLCDKLRRLRFYGMDKTYSSLEHGYNSRLDEIHAAILLCKMDRIDGYIERRRLLAQEYESALSNIGLNLPKTMKDNAHVYYAYVCRHGKRDEIISRLCQKDIFVSISYPYPVHTMKAYQYLGYKSGDLPRTEKAADEIFSLPIYPSLLDEEQQVIISALLDIVGDIGQS